MIVIFKIDRKLDFQNHLIGLDVYKNKRRPRSKNSDFIKYYKKLGKVKNKKERFKIFERRTENFYERKKKKFRDLTVKQIQEMWNLVEKKYINKMEEIHNKKFPFKKVYGILSTSDGYGYNPYGKIKWFACPWDSPSRAIDIAMHEIMHLVFHKYFYKQYKKKFFLTGEQIWTIKEAVTIISNSECRDIMFRKDIGHFGHEKLRAKIEKDWQKYKNFEIVLDKACKYVKDNKIFLKC